MNRYVLASALLAATPALVQPAHATGSLTRTFVSSTGVDTNPCTIAQPCATFAAAYAAVANNGIIAALDPGKYGPLTSITTGVTINGNGWAAITAPARGNGITINAGTAKVTLNGLEIDGAQAAYNGIVLNSAGSLTITNSTVQNFMIDNFQDSNTGNGILIQPTAGTLDFTITNTAALNNATYGIVYLPPSGSANAFGVVDHVVSDANSYGIFLFMNNASAGTMVIAISNSIVSENSEDGIDLQNAGASKSLKVSLDNVSVTGNQGTGILANGTANALLGRSVITGNTTGVFNQTSPNTFYSYGDNRINLNGTDGFSSLNTSTTFSQH